MKTNIYDVTIVGAGIIGLSIAKALKESEASLKIRVLEKEAALFNHASGRNSGVLHAGFYYSPESLKARFTREGNLALRKVAEKYSIPILNTGKVVVTSNQEEELRLRELFERGIKNGVELEILPKAKLHHFEPLARTFDNFLWSPTTAVSDPIKINQAIAQEIRELGVEIVSSTKFGGNKGLDDEFKRTTKYFVNAAGAYADRVAIELGLMTNLRVMPFLGAYLQVPSSALPLRTLVYPTPHPINPFLGAHFTLSADSYIKIGPTAMPVIGREQYGLKSSVEFQDVVQFPRNLIAMIAGSKHNIFEMVRSESPKLLKPELVKLASHLVPSALDVRGWERKRPGIRGQMIDLTTGGLVNDFVIESSDNVTHVLNAVSPGWTAAIPFGHHVADRVLERLAG